MRRRVRACSKALAAPISSFGNEIFFVRPLSAADRVTFSKFSLFHFGRKTNAPAVMLLHVLCFTYIDRNLVLPLPTLSLTDRPHTSRTCRLHPSVRPWLAALPRPSLGFLGTGAARSKKRDRPLSYIIIIIEKMCADTRAAPAKAG